MLQMWQLWIFERLSSALITLNTDLGGKLRPGPSLTNQRLDENNYIEKAHGYGPAQDVPFFYAPSRFSELKNFKSIISTHFSFNFIFK